MGAIRGNQGNIFARQETYQTQTKDIEDNLMRMQLDFQNTQRELDKLPEHGKKIAIINRRRDLEGRAEQLRADIA